MPVTPHQQPKTQSWGIRGFSDMFDVTPRAIRFYEDKGLLAPERTSGHRVFSNSDRARMEKILCAKRIGFSLEDIKQFLEVTDGEVTDPDELVRRKSGFEAVITRLRRKRRDIEIITKDMQDLCAVIDDYMITAPASGVFQFAEAYAAKFRQTMNEDFLQT